MCEVGRDQNSLLYVHVLQALHNRNHHMGSGILPEITLEEHSSLCHPQMQVKIISCTYEMPQCSLLAQFSVLYMN